jgi:hypothetical protein
MFSLKSKENKGMTDIRSKRRGNIRRIGRRGIARKVQDERKKSCSRRRNRKSIFI